MNVTKRPAGPSGTSTAGPMRVGPATTSDAYSTGKHSAPSPLRPGAEDALDLPSRFGDYLHHRGGRVSQFSKTEKKT